MVSAIKLILDLPLWLVGVMVVGGAVALAFALVFILHPVVKRRHGEEHNQVFSDGFAAVGTMYAIVAGLLVFGVFTTFEEASAHSSTEATNLVLMYRDSGAFPQPVQSQAREAITGYLTSVINDDWPALAEGKGSGKTSQALDHLYKVYGPMNPDGSWSDQYTNSVSQLDEVTKLRDQRIENSAESLPGIYWFLLYAGAFITILYLAMAYVGSRAMHAVAVGLMAAMLGLVIFLLLEVNHPFRGEIALSPDNFENALVTISAINSGQWVQ